MSTVTRMLVGRAPAARAASITPGSTVTRLCSTMRLTANAAAIDSANVTAFVPMVVPMTASMSGWMAVMKMTNGMGRTMFTATLSAMNTGRLASRLPGRVAYSASPMTRPRTPPAAIDMRTI